jgi:hypothetical protein
MLHLTPFLSPGIGEGGAKIMQEMNKKILARIFFAYISSPISTRGEGGGEALLTP